MIRFQDISDAVAAYHPNPDLGLLRKAHVFAAKAHQGQVRLSGEPYLAHPLEVALILTKLNLDVPAVAAGLLHDTVEDTDTTMEEIEEVFGQEVGQIVKGVTKISAMEFTSRAQAQAENIRKMVLAMASDIRVLLVKLADRLHNMRTLGFQRPESQVRIAQETLDIYAPLAGRLGIYWIKSELEDLCFYHLEPETYRRIADGVAQRVDRQKAYIKRVTEILQAQMAENRIKARVEGRTKHYYSIYKKMLAQNLALDQLFDIYGFRLIVDKLSACYEALGLVHSLWKPIPGRFKDYINLSKANRYQSLHTSVAHFLLDMIEVDRHVPVGTDLPATDIGDHLLVGGGQAVIVVVAVLEPEQLLAVVVPAARLLPQLGRLDLGHEHLDGSGPVHLLPDDLLHLLKGGETIRQVRVDPRGQLADHGRPEHQDMGDHLRLGRNLPQGGQKVLG